MVTESVTAVTARRQLFIVLFWLFSFSFIESIASASTTLVEKTGYIALDVEVATPGKNRFVLTPSLQLGKLTALEVEYTLRSARYPLDDLLGVEVLLQLEVVYKGDANLKIAPMAIVHRLKIIDADLKQAYLEKLAEQAQLTQMLLHEYQRELVRREKAEFEKTQALEAQIALLKSRNRSLQTALQNRIVNELGAVSAASTDESIIPEPRYDINWVKESVAEEVEFKINSRQALASPVAIIAKTLPVVVQLEGDASVGSGVLLDVSEWMVDLDPTHHYIVTAWHVPRDILGDPPEMDGDVPVQIYSYPEATTVTKMAKVIKHDPGPDLALLRFDDENSYPSSKLTAENLLPQILVVGTPIYAIGCPLGNDPIHTRGEIAQLVHAVDDTIYIMINAPTYVGNSGGGIFAEDASLLTIFSKIYTHGSLRPTIVPHMGLANNPLVLRQFIADYFEELRDGTISKVGSLAGH